MRILRRPACTYGFCATIRDDGSKPPDSAVIQSSVWTNGNFQLQMPSKAHLISEGIAGVKHSFGAAHGRSLVWGKGYPLWSSHNVE